MGTESSSATGAPKNVSRRRVVAGAAWSVPAVMVASAAPAMAASQCLTATFGGESCKYPGSGQNAKGYKLQICFTNNCDISATIEVKSVQGNAASSPLVAVNQTVTVPAHNPQPICLPAFVIYCSTNSGNFLNVTYSVNGAPDQVASLPSPVQTCLGADLCA